MTRALHTKVPGRVRFNVPGLYRSPDLLRLVETRLIREKAVNKVKGSAVTGNLLVHFNPDTSIDDVVMMIDNCLDQAQAQSQKWDKPLSGGHPDNPALLMPAALTEEATTTWSEALKEQVALILSRPEEIPDEAWHLLDTEKVIEALRTDPKSGLSSKVVRERLKQFGPNILPQSEGRSRWSIFAGQFASLPVALLGAAAGVSVLTGGLLDAAVIMGVVAANAVIGYFTESQAERTINSLRESVDLTAHTIRDGRSKEIPSADLVPGDLLVLQPGIYLPADCRVVEAGNLSVDESALTGESMPTLKSPEPLTDPDLPLPDHTNMAFMGTLVTGGQGMAVVTATGRQTQIGMVQSLLDETITPDTPIEKQLARVGNQLVLICSAICGLVFMIGYWRGLGLASMVRTSIALAAAAVPEGLPAAATTTFALGINRMRAHKVLIRKLEAVETLGAVQVACLDKTGTITQNHMTVQAIHAGHKIISVTADGFRLDDKAIDPTEIEELRRLIEISVLCNDAEIDGHRNTGKCALNGSPTENALVELAWKANMDMGQLRKTHLRLEVNHRAENRFFMSTLHTGSNGKRIFAFKGSPGEVIARCSWQMIDGQKTPLTEEDLGKIEKTNEEMAGRALRVLGVAYATLNGESQEAKENNLIWLGLIGMADPIRSGVKEMIRTLHHAGIETVMITGDQTPTAFAVARELGLNKDGPLEIMDASALQDIPPETLMELAPKVHVYSRVSPSNKLGIVQALQQAGLVVAMTGDGINDGPALKSAEIGVAMGRSGTDVARDVADVVLEEDNLETLIIAIRDGRTTQSNIKKSVHFFLATNMSEIMVVFSALAMGIGSPLNTMQLLWINLISDIFPGLALSLEQSEPDVMEQPPRDPNEPIFTAADYKSMLWESGVISAGALGAYSYGLFAYGPGPQARGLAFQTLTIGQLLHAIYCRSKKHSLFSRQRLPRNKHLEWALGGSFFFQALTMFVPGLRNFLGLAKLSLADAGIIAGTSVATLLLNEASKKSADRRQEKTGVLTRISHQVA